MNYLISIITVLTGVAFIWGGAVQYTKDENKDPVMGFITFLVCACGLITIIGGIKLWP